MPGKRPDARLCRSYAYKKWLDFFFVKVHVFYMAEIVDLKDEKICPFLSSFIKAGLGNQTGLVGHPCLKKNCQLYDSQIEDCGLKDRGSNESEK